MAQPSPSPSSPAADSPQSLAGPAILYAWLACASVACLVIANVVGVKLFSYDLSGLGITAFKVEHTAGMLTFPITFLITDLINEYYGKKAARRVAYISFVMGLLVFAVIKIAQAMPPLNAPFNVSQQAFDQILGSSSAMYLASMAAFLVGSISDIFCFTWIKRLTGGKYVWLRATGSTVVSQFIDSFIVTYLAFSLFRVVGGGEGAEPMPMGEVLKTAATGYILKFVIAIALTPAIYAGRAAIRRWMGMQPLPAE